MMELKKHLRGPILISTTLLLAYTLTWTMITGQPHKLTEQNQLITGIEVILMVYGVGLGMDLTFSDWKQILKEQRKVKF